MGAGQRAKGPGRAENERHPPLDVPRRPLLRVRAVAQGEGVPGLGETGGVGHGTPGARGPHRSVLRLDPVVPPLEVPAPLRLRLAGAVGSRVVGNRRTVSRQGGGASVARGWARAFWRTEPGPREAGARLHRPGSGAGRTPPGRTPCPSGQMRDRTGLRPAPTPRSRTSQAPGSGAYSTRIRGVNRSELIAESQRFVNDKRVPGRTICRTKDLQVTRGRRGGTERRPNGEKRESAR